MQTFRLVQPGFEKTTHMMSCTCTSAIRKESSHKQARHPSAIFSTQLIHAVQLKFFLASKVCEPNTRPAEMVLREGCHSSTKHTSFSTGTADYAFSQRDNSTKPHWFSLYLLLE